MDDGRVESVERNTQATNRYGQTASWEGKAERSGAGWEFEGEGKNKYGQKVEAEGYGARGPYGGGVVADVEGGRYGDRTVVAGRAYGGPVHAASLPYGARPYNYHGHSYYGYGGAYYRPYTYHGVPYYGYMPPPWGCYYSTVPVGAIALTVAGMALLYSDGTYYKTTYVEGATQYQVVAPPAGASLPAGTSLPADRASITIAGVTYYLYGNTFYKRVVTNGQESFVVVTKPAGRRRREGAARGLRADAGRQHGLLPLEGPLLPELPRPERRGAVPGGRRADGGRAGDPGRPPRAAPQAAAAAAPAPGPGRQAQGRHAHGAAEHARSRCAWPPRSARAPRRPASASRATSTPTSSRTTGASWPPGAPGSTAGSSRPRRGRERAARRSSRVELTDVEVGGRVVPLSTEPVSFTGEAKKAGKKVLGAAALGAGIGGMIDGGEGAAWGAGAGAVVGVAAAKSSPGNQVAVAAGTAVEFRLARPLSVDIVV